MHYQRWYRHGDPEYTYSTRQTLPIEPLTEFIKGRHETMRETSRQTGLGYRAIQRIVYAERPRITFLQADRVCEALGIHPAHLWPKEW